MAENPVDPTAPTTSARKLRSWEKKPIAKPTDRNKHGEPKSGRQKAGKQLNKIRVQKVESLKEMLFPNVEIVKLIAEEFGCSRQTIYEDLKRIEMTWEEEAKLRTPTNARTQAARTAQRMFRTLRAKGDEKTARRYFQDWCKITGAYAPERIAIVDEREMSTEQLDAAIAEEFALLLTRLSPEERRKLLAG